MRKVNPDPTYIEYQFIFIIVLVIFTFHLDYVTESVAYVIHNSLPERRSLMVPPSDACTIEPLCSDYERPDKQEAISSHKSRFVNNNN